MTDVYTIVWNEEFMLPHFLDHYENVADRIFIIDDHSTDKTAEIAQAHPKVQYFEYGFDGLDEDEFNDTFESFYKTFSRGWVAVVDCDEFITGLLTLGEPNGQVLKTNGYMMIGKTGRLEDCKSIRMKSWDKPIVFDSKLDVRFGAGRHSVNLPVTDSSLELLHYKYPSREYYIERNTEGYKRIAGMDEKEQTKRLRMGLNWYDSRA